MYCSECGAESAKGLKFCKSCGARIAGGDQDVRNSVAKTFATAAVLTGAFGLIGFAVIIKELLASGAKDSFILLIAALYIGGLLAVVYTIIRQVLKLIGFRDDDRKSKSDIHSTNDTAPVLSPPVTRQLNEHREPASVVEETTRNLEKVPAEKG